MDKLKTPNFTIKLRDTLNKFKKEPPSFANMGAEESKAYLELADRVAGLLSSPVPYPVYIYPMNGMALSRPFEPPKKEIVVECDTTKLPHGIFVIEYLHQYGPEVGTVSPEDQHHGTSLVCFRYTDSKGEPVGVGVIIALCLGAKKEVLLFPGVVLISGEITSIMGVNGVNRLSGTFENIVIPKGLRSKVEDEQMASAIATVCEFLFLVQHGEKANETIKPPEKLQKARLKRGHIPFDTYHVLDIMYDIQEEKKSASLGGSHCSPRLHTRRGHIRRLHTGKSTWVRESLVGKAELGRVFKDYRVPHT